MNALIEHIKIESLVIVLALVSGLWDLFFVNWPIAVAISVTVVANIVGNLVFVVIFSMVFFGFRLVLAVDQERRRVLDLDIPSVLA